MNIILKSSEYLEGNSTADYSCRNNLNNINTKIGEANRFGETKKIYKIKFSLSSLTLSPSNTNTYGVYMTGLSKDIKDNFIGILRSATYKNLHMFKTNIDDNPPIYVDSINDTGPIGVKVKNLSTKDYTYLKQ
jgi:hypothetical protein